MDYSKWDKIELSDDSDIEVHPNIDKASMIRWRQAKIHRERRERKNRIEAFTREQPFTTNTLSLITETLSSPIVSCYEAYMAVLNDLLTKKVLPREREFGDGIGEMWVIEWNERWGQPTLDESVENRVKFEKVLEMWKVKWEKSPQTWSVEAVKRDLEELKTKVVKRLEEVKRLKEKEEKEAAAKMTSENIGTITKDRTMMKKEATSPKKEKVIETLNNPNPTLQPPSSSSADTTPTTGETKETVPKLPYLDEFSKCPNMESVWELVKRQPNIISPTYGDQLLALAFESELVGKSKLAQQCVHHSLICQYCKALGKEGIGMFFKKMMTSAPNHEGVVLFMKDVQDTYARLLERVNVLRQNQEDEERAEREEMEAKLSAAQRPDGTYAFPSPPEDAPEEEKKRVEVFNTLEPEFQRALMLSDVDEINAYLSKIGTEEAEKVVKRCNEVGLIQLELED